MGLKGDLGELPLPDLVEMTSVGGKSGRLVLFDEEDAVAGVLMFRSGRLVGAQSGELTAEKAFYALLGLKTGSFDFDSTAELDEDEVNLPTESLLIEGMRRLDETYRLRRRLPSPAVVRYRGGDAEDPLEARLLGLPRSRRAHRRRRHRRDACGRRRRRVRRAPRAAPARVPRGRACGAPGRGRRGRARCRQATST